MARNFPGSFALFGVNGAVIGEAAAGDMLVMISLLEPLLMV